MTKTDYCGTIIGYQELSGEVQLGILVEKLASEDDSNVYYRVKWFNHANNFEFSEDLYHENDIKEFLLPRMDCDDKQDMR